MAHIRYVARTHRRTLMKTGSYYLMHMVVAAAVAHFFHERAWARRDAAPLSQAGPPLGGVTALR